MNPYDLAATSPSSWRVYLFRHLGSGRAFPPAGVKRDQESTTPFAGVKRSEASALAGAEPALGAMIG